MFAEYGGGVCAIAILILLLCAALLAACNETAEKTVLLTGKDVSVFVGEDFDPAQMFTLTVDGEQKALADADDLEVTGAKTSSTGVYDVTCSLKVDGRSYSATGKLTVVEKRAATLTRAYNTIVPVTIGEDFDFTTLFTATVAGEPYALSEENVDLSAVNLETEGLYSVNATLTIDNTPYSASAPIYVIDAGSLDLEAALKASYDDYTVKLTATEGDASYTEIRKIAPDKYAYEAVGKEWSYVYEMSEDGTVKQGYKYDSTTQQWSRSSDGNDQTVFRYLSPEELSKDQFFLNTNGYFSVPSSESLNMASIVYDLTGMTDGYGEVNGVDVRVENRKIVKVIVRAEYGEFVHEYYDFGSTNIDIPYVEPIVNISSIPAEVVVNTVTEYDFTKLFSIDVDGKRYELSADEAAEMIDSSKVKFDEVGDYEVTIVFTAPNGKVSHTETATFSVKEPAVLTFKEALLALAENCTVTKYTSTLPNSKTVYYINKNNCFDNNASTLYDLSSYNPSDGSINSYAYENGVLSETAKNSKTRIPQPALVAAVADDFEEGENGTYVYTGDALNSIIYSSINSTNGISVEVDFANGVVSAIRLSYKLTATATKPTVITWEISAVGSTVLPAQLPTA